ncbi:MAG TPA: hypothetical protein VFC12_00650 [Terriglobales bacterium]|nr:hypothetical protein [Terriglobales bacterium]
MSTTVDQPDRQQTAVTAKGPNPAVVSLNRALQAVLVSEEAAEIGRAVAQIVRGDGWQEAKSSAVMVEAVIGWLGRDIVTPIGFYSNGTGPVEALAKVGSYYITGRGIDHEDDIIINCCERHRGARFSQSRTDELDLSAPNSRFTMGTPLAQRAANRLAGLLADELDPEIARVVLGS